MEVMRKESMEVQDECEHKRVTKVTTNKLFIPKKLHSSLTEFHFIELQEGKLR